MEILCCETNSMVLEETKELLLKAANSAQKAFHQSRQGNVSATQKQVLKYVLENHKSGCPITTDNMNEGTQVTSLTSENFGGCRR